MIALLGSSGYVGTYFRKYFEQHNIAHTSLRRSDVALENPKHLAEVLGQAKAKCLINCAGCSGKPNVDACELHRAECLLGNAILPSSLATSCAEAGIPWGHVSSGCIYTGRRTDGAPFTEADPPNFSFRQNNCSFYSGTKALGEELLAGIDRCYIWRMRIPFDNLPNPRNYLQKLISYSQLLEAENSLSQIDEFVAACVDSFRLEIPFGIYNMTNPGSIKTSEVTEMIARHGITNKRFEFFVNEQEFMQTAAVAPRSNCVLDSTKTLQAGLTLTPIHDAIETALNTWQGKRSS